MVPETPTEFDFNWFSDDIARRRTAGQSVRVEDYVTLFPDHETEIREAFPVLCLLAEQDPPVDTSDPDQINGYHIVREIGRGGMGIVYEATHPKLSRRMAIKVLTPAQAGKTKLQERFAREAETASRLSHPHIVPLFDFGETDGQSFLVMPFIAGRGLDDILNQHWERQQQSHTEQHGPPSAGRRITADGFVAHNYRRVASLGANVASALAHAHEQRAIHRDIKPANLLLDDNGKVWVTDFGLAKLRDDNQDLSLSGDIIGTPRYMAPEQIRGQSDERSDIYSLGVTLWELASGARAWHAVRKGEVLSVKSSFDLPRVQDVNPDVPDVLARIIGRCCAFHPRDRYPSAADVQQALNRFAHDGSSTDRRFVSRESLSRAATSRPFFMTVVSCLLALSAALIYSHRSDSQSAARTAADAAADSAADSATHPVATAQDHRVVAPANSPPIIVGPRSFTPALFGRQTAFPALQLTAIDADRDRFSWELQPGPDASFFVVQRLTGHLCVSQPSLLRRSAARSWDLSVRATDHWQPQLAVLTTDRHGHTRVSDLLHQESKKARDDWCFPQGPTPLPGRLLGVWTNDGEALFHVHVSNDGTVPLYESRWVANRWKTTLQQPDTGLLPTICGMTQHGDEYLSVRETRDGFVLEWLQQSADHRFRPFGDPLSLPQSSFRPNSQRPAGLSCLGVSDFQLITQTADNYCVLELAVNHEQMLGLREIKRDHLPTGSISGLCGWLAEHPVGPATADARSAATVHIQVRCER